MPQLPFLFIVLGCALTITLRKSLFDSPTCHHGHQRGRHRQPLPHILRKPTAERVAVRLQGVLKKAGRRDGVQNAMPTLK